MLLVQLNVVKSADGVASVSVSKPGDVPAVDDKPAGAGASAADDQSAPATAPTEVNMATATAVPAPPVKRVRCTTEHTFSDAMHAMQAPSQLA